MNQDPFKSERYVREKLDKFHVDVPDFPMKNSKWERLINFLASPAKIPFDSLMASTNGVFLLKLIPVTAGAVLAGLQVLFVM